MQLIQLPHSTFSKDDLISVEQYSAQMFIVLSLPQKSHDTKFFKKSGKVITSVHVIPVWLSARIFKFENALDIKVDVDGNLILFSLCKKNNYLHDE